MPEPESFSSRLRQVRDEFGLPQIILAAISGASRRSWQSWEAGTAEPGASRVAEISQRFGISPFWLLLGRGEMFDPELQTPLVAELRALKELSEKDRAALAAQIIDRLESAGEGSAAE